MADDIVIGLRDFAGADPDGQVCLDAAAEIERLRRLERYVEHRETCQSLRGGGRPCSCGLSDLLRSSRD